jgi:predicted RNA polymerase sigma factor
LLLRLERYTQAAEALSQALGCRLNGAERDYLTRKLRDCTGNAAGAASMN